MEKWTFHYQWKDSKWVNAKLYVVDVLGTAIVGLSTSEALKLLTVNIVSITVNANTVDNKETEKQFST